MGYTAAAAKSLQLCPTLQPHRQQPTRLPRPLDSPGKNTGVGCHFLLQGIKLEGGVLCQILGSGLKNLDASLPESCDDNFGSSEPLCLTSDFPEAFMRRGHGQALNQQF